MTKAMVNEAVEETKEEYKKVWGSDVHMYDYCCGELSNALKLENGFLYEFRKPRIKKDFCFGAGQNGVTTEEDWSRANNMVTVANSNSDYFVRENMRDSFGSFSRLFEDMKNGWSLYAKDSRYSSCNEELKLANICSEKHLVHRDEDRNSFYKLTDKDIENLKAILKEEQDKFAKRLNTYLKRYGLSKVNAWSYISD